jgi:hypothetical protein
MTQEQTIARIKARATEFRQALELTELTAVTFTHFPHGSCCSAAVMLARYLEKRGCGAWTLQTVLDQYGSSHAWLEQDGLVVDITADQFSDEVGAVIVADAHPLAEQFPAREDRLFRPSFRGCLGALGTDLDCDYQAVMRALERHTPR